MFLAAQDVPAGSEGTAREGRYWRNVEARDKADQAVQRKDKRRFCAWLLAVLFRQLLFPRLSAGHWTSIQPQVEAALALHLHRVQYGGIFPAHQKIGHIPLWSAFRLVRRGIVKVHEQMKKHPEKADNGSLRANPLRYLALDAPPGSFTFKNVMETWVVKEFERMQRHAHSEGRLMAWQMAFNKKEELARNVLKKLWDGHFDAFTEDAQISFDTLQQFAHQAGCTSVVKKQLFASFSAEIMAVRSYLLAQADTEYSGWIETFHQKFQEAAKAA